MYHNVPYNIMYLKNHKVGCSLATVKSFSIPKFWYVMVDDLSIYESR